jgi:rhamnosyltransferase
MQIKCSIVIRAYNEEKYIGRLLFGLKEQTLNEGIEIILVDSGSTDLTVSIAKSMGVRVVSIPSCEFTFGRSLNRGCEVANGEFLLFASAHVYPTHKNWIQLMLQPFDNPEIALVYGRQIGNELSKFSEVRLFNKWFPSESIEKQNGPFCNNANSVIRKVLWEQQKFDEELTGLEDLDWSTKMLKKGYKISYCADATVVHVHEETNAKIFNRYKREAIALKHIMPFNRFNFFDFLFLSSSNIISDLYYSILSRSFRQNFGGIITFRILQFWGTYQGFKANKQVTEELKRKFYYPNRLMRSSVITPSLMNEINYSSNEQLNIDDFK